MSGDSDLEESDFDDNGFDIGQDEDESDVDSHSDAECVTSNTPIENGDEAVIQRTGKKRKRSKNKNDKVSKSEARELLEREHSYSSNLYRVQIEEVLHEVSITDKRKKEVDCWVNDFEIYINQCQHPKPFELTNFKKILRDVKLPLPSHIRPPSDGTETIQWAPPESVEIIGSWKSSTAVEKFSSVDVAVELPMGYLRAKDYLNHKYHTKRALYLAFLAKLLSQRGDVIHFTVQQGNPLKPVIEIDCETYIIRIIIIPSDCFKLTRFSPDKNNVRFLHYFKRSLPESDPEYATPNYNFSILTDVLSKRSQDEIYAVIQASESYTEATKLLKLWLHQRCLDKGFGGFSGFIVSAFVAYLVSAGKINQLMSCYDVVRAFFLNISQMDLTNTGIGFCSSATFSDWQLQFDVVFLDASGMLNYTSDISKFTYKRIQLEANRALSVLEGNKVPAFYALFLTPVSFVRNFDHIIQIPIDVASQLRNPDYDQLSLNHSGFQYPVVQAVFGSLMEKCLGNRVTLIDHELLPEHRWKITEPAPDCCLKQCIQFGFIIIRDAAYKLVEKCDAENSILAQSFKAFWGTKSQLRRFKDGTMCETVVFEDKTRVLLQMLTYIFQKHLDLKPSVTDFGYIDCQIEDVVERGLLLVKKLQKPKRSVFLKGKRKKPSINDLQDFVPVELDSISNKASTAFDDLSKILRAMEGLPLEVSTVQGISCVLRFSNIHPTPSQHFFLSKLTEVKPKQKSMTFITTEGVPLKVPKVMEPITVVLHLETSGKWPDDIEAIDRLKCAFLIRIGQLLNEQFGLVVQPHPRYLDVLKDGFIFRIKLTYYRELILLKQQMGSDGVVKVRDNPESLRLERESLLLPQLTTTLHAFQRQFEVFGKTCRIAKRWMASQLLLSSPLQYNRNPEQPDPRFSEESVELIVAHLFLFHAPHLNHPNEAQLGFIRFLFLLSNFDWKASPIILNFHDKLSPKEVSTIELDFVKRRDQLPPLFIATPEDKTVSVWTKHLAPVIVHRAQLLAKEAVNVLKCCLVEGGISDDVRSKKVKMVFRPDTEGFDVLIHLKKSMNPQTGESVDAMNIPQFKEYTKTTKEMLPIVDFDPVQLYLQELRSTFGHVALFLHDTYGGKFIAIVWKRDAFKKHEFTISNINTRTLARDGKVVTNIEEIIETIELIGKGMIETIERN